MYTLCQYLGSESDVTIRRSSSSKKKKNVEVKYHLESDATLHCKHKYAQK